MLKFSIKNLIENISSSPLKNADLGCGKDIGNDIRLKPQSNVSPKIEKNIFNNSNFSNSNNNIDFLKSISLKNQGSMASPSSSCSSISSVSSKSSSSSSFFSTSKKHVKKIELTSHLNKQQSSLPQMSPNISPYSHFNPGFLSHNYNPSELGFFQNQTDPVHLNNFLFNQHNHAHSQQTPYFTNPSFSHLPQAHLYQYHLLIANMNKMQQNINIEQLRSVQQNAANQNPNEILNETTNSNNSIPNLILNRLNHHQNSNLISEENLFLKQQKIAMDILQMQKIISINQNDQNNLGNIEKVKEIELNKEKNKEKILIRGKKNFSLLT